MQRRPGTPELIYLKRDNSCSAICQWGECSRLSSQGPECHVTKSWPPITLHKCKPIILELYATIFFWSDKVNPKQSRKRIQNATEREACGEGIINQSVRLSISKPFYSGEEECARIFPPGTIASREGRTLESCPTFK